MLICLLSFEYKMPFIKLKLKADSLPIEINAAASLVEVNTSNLVLEDSNRFKYQVKLRTSSEPLSKQFPIRSRPQSAQVYDDLSSTERGDNLVWKVYDTLLSFDNISEIANTSGISGNSFDLVIRTIDCKLRGIQVKTLISRNVTEQYKTNLSLYTYPDQTLMIFADAKYNRFVVAWWKDIKLKSTLSINFLKDNADPSFVMFDDIKLYKYHIYNQVSHATIIDDVRDSIRNSSALIEYDYTKRIQYVAESFGILFEYENTDGSAIDFYLNGQACQSKVTGIVKNNRYHFHLKKTVNGKACPYTDCDGIKYFILAIDDYTYKNNVLIIPIQHLIEGGYIKTDQQDGIMSVCLPPPNFCKYHWSNSMWNNWTIIMQNLQFIDDPISLKLNQYHDSYFLMQPSSRSGSNYPIHITYSAFSDETIKYYIVILNNTISQLYPDWIWIISKSELIYENKFPTIILKDKCILITPPPPYYIPSLEHSVRWSTKYWQRI
jgi:hypothetical protein